MRQTNFRETFSYQGEEMEYGAIENVIGTCEMENLMGLYEAHLEEVGIESRGWDSFEYITTRGELVTIDTELEEETVEC